MPTSVSSWRLAARQATNAASIARWRSSSLAAYHGESKGSAAHTVSSSATSCAWLIDGSATRACTTDPSVELSCRTPVPPWRSASQRSGQSVRVCKVDGLNVTVCSSPLHSGSSVLTSPRPCHCCGSAPGTPAAANRPNCSAAQARRLSSTAPGGAQTTARSRPTTAAGESTCGACTGGTPTAGMSPVANRASSGMNTEGSMA